MDYQQVGEGKEPAATTTTTTTTQAATTTTKEPEYPPQPQAQSTGYTKKPNTTVVTVVEVDPASHPATSSVDGLYITATILSAFGSGLSFAGVWNATYHYNQVSSTYVAFAFLFLFATWPQTIFLIKGLTHIPVERVALLQSSGIITIWNLICLIIAIATEWTSIQSSAVAATTPGLGLAPATLLTALCVETGLLSVQITAHVYTGKNDPATLAVYLPIVFAKPVVRDLLIANAVLFNIVLAFSVADLIYLSPIQDVDLGATYNAGAAFAVIFFFISIIGTVVSIVSLIPTAIPGPVLVLASWIFSFFAFIVALIAWFLQIFSKVETEPDQMLVSLLGWIFALGTLCVGLAAFCALEQRVCLPTRPNHALTQAKDMAEIEKARLDAVQYRKQREALEYGHSPAQV